jgi:hypothetical protein
MFRRWIALFAVIFTTVVVTAPSPASVEQRTWAGPPRVAPAYIRFTHRVLDTGRPQQVGLLPEYVQRMRADAERYLVPTSDHPGHSAYAGAVVLAAKDAVAIQRTAVGMAVRYRLFNGEAGDACRFEVDGWAPSRTSACGLRLPQALAPLSDCGEENPCHR